MSYQTSSHHEIYCFEKECALWDEEKGQCCLKSAALAVAGKRSGGSGNIPLQAEYIYPTSATPSFSGDRANPHPYIITCDTNGATIQ